MRRKWWIVSTLLVGTAVAGTWGVLKAQTESAADLDKALSPYTSIYVRLEGSDKLKESFEKTAAYNVVYKSGLAATVTPIVEKAMQMATQGPGAPPEAQETMKTVHKAIEHIAEHGITIGIVPRVLGTEATFLIHDAKRTGLADEAQSRVNNFLELAGIPATQKEVEGRTLHTISRPIPSGQTVQFGWWIEGPHLAVTVGFADPAVAVRRAAGVTNGLPTAEQYSVFRPREGYDRAGHVWLDIESLVAQIPVPQVASFLEKSGLKGLKGIKVQFGVDGDAMRSDIDVIAPSPRTGFLKLIDAPALNLGELPNLPADCDAVSIATMDLAAGYDIVLATLEPLLQEFNPDSLSQLKASIQQIEQHLQYKLREDLLAALGEKLVIYQSPLDGPFGFGGINLAISVKDRARLTATLDRQVELIKEMQPKIFVDRKQIEGADFWIGGVREPGFPLAPTIALNDNWLVIGAISPAQVQRFLRLQSGDAQGWKVPERLSKSIESADGTVIGISYTNPQPLANMIATSIPILAAALRNAVPELEIDLTTLPEVERLVVGLFPGSTVTSIDDTGLHLVSHSSLPMVGVGGMGGVSTGMGVAMLLPALQQSREAARRSQDANNLKQIALALHNFHDVYKTFPQGTDKKAAGLPVEERLSWMASVLPFIDQAAAYENLRFGEKWNSENNSKVSELKLKAFLNPNLPDNGSPNVTHYVGMAGVGKDAAKLKANDAKAGVFGYDRETQLRDIRDGTSNTIGVMGVNKQFGPWAQGGPSTIRGLTEKPYVGGPDGFQTNNDGVHAMFCDGSVRFLSKNIDPVVLEALVTKSGGEVVNP